MTDSTGEGSSKDAPAPPKKRSLFGNPAWSKPQESKEGIDFFSRAKELYPMRVAEEERKLQKKLAKQRQERKRSTASAEQKASSTPEVKRQRLSSEAQEDGYNSSDDSPNKQLRDDIFSSYQKSTLVASTADYVTRARSPGSPTARSVRTGRTMQDKIEEHTQQKPIPDNIISLSDSEDAGRNKRSMRRTRRTAAQPITLDDDDGDDIYPVRPVIQQDEDEDPQLSEEEFPELVQRAREREKQKELERLRAAEAFGEQNLKPSTPVIDDVFQDSDIPEVDPVVEILVTSWIEGTKPLLVRRRLNQRLKEVKLSWCDKQALYGGTSPAELRAAIFLTWNGKRLFDASTCKHLGIKMGVDGRFASDGEGFDDHGRLHFEAWTDELLTAYQNSTQLQQDGGEDQEDPEVDQDQPERIKLLLKAREMEPFRLRVKATTLVRRICDTFRNEKNIPAEKDIALYFDGDKLDPDMKVEDAELTDMDTVEVHIR